MQPRPRRFPIEGRVDFKVPGKRSPKLAGIGLTENISARGILFATPSELAVGDRVDLVVHLGGAPNDQWARFRARGRVLRKQNGFVAVTFLRRSLLPNGRTGSA